jgi:hypothetical protein
VHGVCLTNCLGKARAAQLRAARSGSLDDDTQPSSSTRRTASMMLSWHSTRTAQGSAEVAIQNGETIGGGERVKPG